VLGELRGRGLLALAIPDDEEDPACEVVWVEPELEDRPLTVANTLADWLAQWCAADFVLQESLQLA
jgi:hypothetical protein